MLLKRYLVLVIILVDFVNGQSSRINTYGYFDIETAISDLDKSGKIWSFDQHHLNIITTYHIDQAYTIFTEMEWEHGPFHSANYSTGNIYLTRAWFEYKHSEAIKLQAGKILLPFGIYGVRYDATPTFLSVSLPSAIYGKYINSAGVESRLFAKYVTGVQFTGMKISNTWSMEYFISLTNGRGPNAAQKDNNSNKGVGARVLIFLFDDIMQYGFSYYSDRDGNSQDIQQNAFGVDALLTLTNLTVSSEFILVDDELLDQELNLSGDYRRRMGIYLQGSYMIGEHLTPYLRLESFRPEESTDLMNDKNFILGLNYSITPRIYFKGDYSIFSFKDITHNDYQQIALALAVAF